MRKTRIVSEIPRVLVIQSTANRSGEDKVRGIFNYAKFYGPWNIQLLQGVFGEPAPRTATEWRSFDGIIAGQQIYPYAKEVARTKCPLVMIDELDTERGKPLKLTRVSTVGEDSAALGELAAQYFLDRGCANFAYVGMYNPLGWSIKRGDAFAHALAMRGRTCAMFSHTLAADVPFERDRVRLARFLTDAPKPLAVLAANDARARQVLTVCRELGLEIPREVAVLGVDDDTLLCEGSIPSLSSIRRDCVSCGMMAAECLDAAIRHGGQRGAVRRLVYGPETISERTSTDFRRLGVPPIVQRIQEMIRLNARSAIRITEIVQALHVSRRYAEIKFREATGRSILEAITAARMEIVAHLLRHTDLSLSEIANRCAFVTDIHLRRQFKQHFGVSMTDYRKHDAERR